MHSLRCLALFLFASASLAQSSGSFDLMANYTGIGAAQATIVGPGPTPGSQRFYAAVLYWQGTLDLLSIDPNTGDTQVFHSPLASESGAWGITLGPDGNIYLGTSPHAHIFKFDPIRQTFIDLGRPSSTEQWIFSITFGSDHRLYGVTFPHAKLVRYDPATGKLEDLGRLDPTQEYAHSIAASADGFIYAGIGSSVSNIAAYKISSGQIKEILPTFAQTAAFANVYPGTNGKIFGTVVSNQFKISQWTAAKLSGPMVPPTSQRLLADGRFLSLSNAQDKLTLSVTNYKTHTSKNLPLAYQGKNLPLFRIGFGPDGILYGSSVLPSNLVRIDLIHKRAEDVGNLGGGEAYSLLNFGAKLLIAGYAELAPLISYRPGFPYLPAATLNNPTLVSFSGENSSWRPEAMIRGLGGNVYVSGIAGYGLLGSPLIEWDTKNGSIRKFDDIVHEQCIVSLVKWRNFILGGTSVKGGPGSHPTQREAMLFFWNPKTQLKTFEVVPVAGATNITDLIAAPNGLVYGIAGGTTLFEFNPARKTIMRTLKLPFNPMQGPTPLYNCASVDASGNIWGLTQEGIFRIDTKKFQARLIARSPVKITGGYAMREGKIYFISASAIYSYTK